MESVKILKNQLKANNLEITELLILMYWPFNAFGFLSYSTLLYYGFYTILHKYHPIEERKAIMFLQKIDTPFF